MATAAKTNISARSARVYCENSDTAALLTPHRHRWEVLPFPAEFPACETNPTVIMGESPAIFSAALRAAIEGNTARLIYVLHGNAELPREASGTPVFGYLARPLQPTIVGSMVSAALDNLTLSRNQDDLRSKLERARSDINELNEIGIALSTQRDTQSLLDMILHRSREITSADAGSLYLVEESDVPEEKRLRFKLTHNDSLRLGFTEFSLPINSSSIAGYVALTGEMLHLEDVYLIPPSLPFRFNVKFDQEAGYRCKSMLVIPMKNPQGEILGVLQLINSKRDPSDKVTVESADRVVVPFPESRRAMVSSLASQAAVAIENNRLYESIQALFEGFVKASVVAIEARDPTTSGHSFRVADLTVGLAEAVDRCETAPFRDVTFNRAEMKEIRYASLLHDFGKVGVREEVLVKAKKLYPQQLEVVQQRFDYVRKAVEQKYTERKLNYILEKGRDEFLASQEWLNHEQADQLKAVDDYLKFVLQCNEPTVLPEGNFQKLVDLAAFRYQNWLGQEQPLLSPHEAKLLSIPKGSLDEAERLQIESHVVHTFNFLSQIPWTKEIRNIPIIARAHHEKLNGTGYPFKLTEIEIPVQSKLMTVSDIYDALSASDRPYKKAVPTEKALDIIGMEAKANLIDPDVYRIFIEAEVYKKTVGWKHPSQS